MVGFTDAQAGAVRMLLGPCMCVFAGHAACVRVRGSGRRRACNNWNSRCLLCAATLAGVHTVWWAAAIWRVLAVCWLVSGPCTAKLMTAQHSAAQRRTCSAPACMQVHALSGLVVESPLHLRPQLPEALAARNAGARETQCFCCKGDSVLLLLWKQSIK